MTPTDASAEYKRGALLGYLQVAATILSGLIVTPAIIHSLGIGTYGVYTLAAASLAALTFVETGLSRAVTRFVARATQHGLHRSTALVASAGLMIFSAITAIALLAGIAAYIRLDDWLQSTMTAFELDLFKDLYALFLVNLAISLPSAVFPAISMGVGRFTVPRSIQLARTILRVVVIIALLELGTGARSLVVADTLINACQAIAFAAFVFLGLGLRLERSGKVVKYAKRICAFSVWSIIFAALFGLEQNVGQIVVGLHLDAVQVAIFAVGVMISGYFGGLANVFAGLQLPLAARLVRERASGEVLTAQTIAVGYEVGRIISLAFAGFFLFGREFLSLWVGADFEPAYYVALALIGAHFPRLILIFANALIEAHGLIWVRAVIFSVCFALSIVAASLLVEDHGLIAVALSIASGWLVGQLLMMVNYRRVVGLHFGHVAITLGRRLALPVALSLIPGLWIAQLEIGGWVGLIGKSLAYTAIFFALVTLLNVRPVSRIE